MAYTPLRTDFKDDILDSSNYKRKYKQVVNSDGTFSFQDETTYQQVGSDYGAKEVNEERAAINNVYENKLVALDDVALVTEEGFFVDALAVKELNSNLTNANAKISALSTELATTNTNLKTATADSGWKYMTNANNLSEKLKFRKIGHMVFVAGSIRFSDNGKFANDQALGSVPSGMTPNGYDEFECLIPIAMHNGGPAGTQARIYIKNGGVYIVGTDSASFVMIATTAYFS